MNRHHGAPRHRLPLERLRRLFTEDFTAEDVAQPLPLFAARCDAVETATTLRARGVEVAGVLERGDLVGWVDATSLTKGTLADHTRTFADGEVIAETTPLAEVIQAVHAKERCFVRVFEQPFGLITRQDLEKAPVRMWLFGMITLLETSVTDAVKHFFPGERWMALLPEGRLNKMMELWRERQRRRQLAEPLECLQLADKVLILVKDPGVRKELGIESRKRTETLFQRIQSLRNNLAHTQEIVTYDWDAIVELSHSLDEFLAITADDRFRTKESSP